MRQTVNMRIRPGSLFPSIGIERASIAHETVASVVVIVMVCSVLRVDFTIYHLLILEIWNEIIVG